MNAHTPTPDLAELEARLARIGPLAKGAHPDHNDMCVTEAVAFVAGEPWSDSPACASPVISAFLRAWNDSLDDARRDALLRPFIPRLIGTAGSADTESRRATMAADWLVRVHTPAWLRLAGLTVHADALAVLPEITDFAQCPPLMPALNAARADATDAGDAGDAGDARDAAFDAVKAAAATAAVAATWAPAAWAARDLAWAAVKAAAATAAWAAAATTTGIALRETVEKLQTSAVDLVDRMILADEVK